MAAQNLVGSAQAVAGLLSDIDTAKRNALGTEVWDSFGNCYKYTKGVASLAAGDWVIINADMTVARALNTPLSGPLGVAMSANILATTFGWVQIIGFVDSGSAGNGLVTANIATDASADKRPLYLGATAGRLTTTAAANPVSGAWASGAAASNLGSAWINRPFSQSSSNAGGGAAQGAVAQSQPADPSGTTSTTMVMMGLAGAITPQLTGRISITLSGQVKQSTTADGAKWQLSHGTGAAPANAAALTGTQDGSNPTMTFLTGVLSVPFSSQAIVTGLAIGTAVWVDVALAAVTAGTASMTNLSLTLEEV